MKFNVSEYSFEENIYKYKEDKVKGEIDKIIKKTPKFVLFSYFYCLVWGYLMVICSY